MDVGFKVIALTSSHEVVGNSQPGGPSDRNFSGGRKMLTLRSLSLLAIGSATFVAGPALAETKLLVDVYFPRTHALYLGWVQPFQADVAKATSGSVAITTSGSRLAPSKRQWESVAKGVSDVTVQFVNWQRQRLFLPQVAGLPFNFSSGAQSSVAMWRTHKKFFESANEYKGMKLLSFIVSSGNHFMNGTRPLEKIGDFKGLKIRVSAGDQQKMVSLLGASAVTSSGSQIFEFVSKGVVDGAAGPHYMATTYKIARYIKYATDVPGTIGATIFGVYMNQKKWDGLSAAERKAITSVSGERIARRGGAAFDSNSNKGRKAMVAQGVKFSTASPELIAEMKKRWAPITNAWLEKAAKRNVDGKAAIKFLRAQAFASN
jgi:TRAP-type C4-dicarboxylate transport system substrate-binding protein